METRTPTPPTPVYPTAQPFAADAWDQPSKRHDFVCAFGAVVAIVAIVAACIAMVHGREALGPSKWDPRVEPLVAFVEEARGYTFAHPVYVEFLTAERYRAHATDEGPISDDDRRYYRTSARFFRALGLIGGDVDLAAEQDEINDSGTLAQYSPADRTVYVRGVEVTPSLRVTLVHELTHALQDQVFNLNLSRTQSDGEAFALRALAEGDAIRIENKYFATLSDDEQRQIADQAESDRSSSKALNSSTPILLALFGAPYDLGVPFVRMLASIDGELDRAFRSPPTSEENVFDPASFLNDDLPQHVTPAQVPAGASYVGEMGSDVGVVLWYLLIATHYDPKKALTAVTGWGGDAMTVYEEGGVLCTAMIFHGDTQLDANEMYNALTPIAAKLFFTHKPKMSIDASDVMLTLCDPGPSAKLPPRVDAASIFVAPTVRSLLLGIALEDAAVSVDKADCAVDKTVDRLSEAEMSSLLEASSREDPFVRQVLSYLQTAITGCP